MPDDTEVELLELVARLDAENEHLRMRALLVLEWMEDSVTDLVAQERRTAEYEHQAACLQTELDAMRSTRLWRIAQPLRTARAGLLRRIRR